MNFAETSGIARMFTQAGHTVSEKGGISDIVVINSCVVTDVAEKKCRAAIRSARRKNPEAIIAVIGCFSQLREEELTKMDEVDIVVGNERKYDLQAIIDEYRKDGKSRICNTNILKTRDFVPGYSINDRTRSFLKIQDGCNYRCSYCTIPDARGRSRSGKISEIIELIKELDERGLKEIVLTGVNIGDFGRPHGETLHELLKEISTLDIAARIRIGSIEPELLTDGIIEIIAQSQHLMPHFHLPLQSASDSVLRAMKRKYDTALFRDRVEKIVSSIPDACIACDVIAGFPGETDSDFESSYRFIESLPLSYMHVFTFSERKNTPAQLITPKISTNVKRARSRSYQHLSDYKKTLFYKRFIGSEREVLFESDNQDDMIQGFTDNYIRVKQPWNPALINQTANVLLGAPDNDDVLNGVVKGIK